MNELAQKVVESYRLDTGDTQAAFDPAFILVILDLVEQIMAMFKNCDKTPTEAVEIARSPSLWQRLAVRSLVRNQLGIREFRQHGDKLVKALLETGEKISVDELNRVW